MNLSQILIFSTFVQDYASNHHALSLAVKQVLLHEVRLLVPPCISMDDILTSTFVFPFHI